MKKAVSKHVSGANGAWLALDRSLFRPGERICVAVSGGADSTALLRVLLAERTELGIVLSVLHVEHGLRGASSAHDAAFVFALAEQFNLPCEVVAVDTPNRAAQGKESIEEAARNLRYEVFRDVLASGKADKIATAHTLDDQAETVLMKMLRGAWTEGLSGIHPVLSLIGEGSDRQPQVCIRPLLAVARAEIVAYLEGLGQRWCEDETNESFVHTRNRVRHDLMPRLKEYNPRVAQTLARVAANARAEEEHWQGELARVLPQLLLPGKPVRGGGRSVPTAPGSSTMALDVARLRTLDAGLRRRVLRATVERCGGAVDFEATERLVEMIGSSAAIQNGHQGKQAGRVARRLELPGGVRVERSARELQFERVEAAKRPGKTPQTTPDQIGEYALPVPGTVDAPRFQARYTMSAQDSSSLPDACVRAWQAGDRVELAHSRGPKKVKEILERMSIRGEERKLWPVIVWRGEIVWMRGVELAVGNHADSAGRDSAAGAAVPQEVRRGNLSRIKIEETRY